MTIDAPTRPEVPASVSPGDAEGRIDVLRFIARARRMRDDPLRYLREAVARDGDVFPLPNGSLCVGDPVRAAEVLTDAGRRYADRSDFHTTPAGVFGSRAEQAELGRAARELLLARLAAAAADLPVRVGEAFAPGAAWPEAGVRLLRRHFGPVLLSPAAGTDAIVDDIVAGGLAAATTPPRRGRRRDSGRDAVALRVTAAVATEIAARAETAGLHPAGGDLLGAVLRTAPAGTPVELVAEVFTRLVLSTVVNTGLALSWAVHLTGTAGPDERAADPAGIVRESLRLQPVAWMLRRLAPDGAGPAPVHVSVYLAHRHAGTWSEPDAFRPGRWAAAVPAAGYLPFGRGPHACPGASVVTATLESVLALAPLATLTVDGAGAAPVVTSTLAPPPFRIGHR